MNNKTRITYRFDPESKTAVRKAERDQAIQEQASGRKEAGQAERGKVIPLHNHVNPGEWTHSEITPWNSPFQDDPSALEELIRSADRKARRRDESDAELYADGRNGAGSRDIRDTKGDSGSKTSGPIEWSFPPGQGAKGNAPRVPGTGEDAESRLEYYSGDWGAVYMDPPGDDPDEESHDIYSSKPIVARYVRSSASPSWMKVFVTVAGALATGALFGYLLLSFFTGTAAWPGTAEGGGNGDVPAITGNTGEPGASPSAAAGGSVKAGADSPLAAVNIPEQTYYLLQYGVFGSAEGRDAALGELAAKGVSGAAISTSQDYRVYAAMAADREEAEALKKQFGGSIDLYVKTFTVGAVDQLPFAGSGEELHRFVERTNGLQAMLLGLVNVQLERESPVPFSESASAAWRQAAEQWNASSEAVKDGFADEASRKAYERLSGAVKSAIEAVDGYEGNPSRVYLWKAQTALMEAAIAQKNWFEPGGSL
ncbi:SPOR domain-containing protein [Paenibacillus thailandensis]|uniref:SPOR domain-containing protein n=1 Tax=Paenibacillus thailandensis TaxID=393250 RepID=A0ABW5QR68_9BACL